MRRKPKILKRVGGIIKIDIMSGYCFKCTVKSGGHFLPKGYTFQVVHSQRTLDDAAVNRQAQEEYKKLNGGKSPGSSMYKSAFLIEPERY